MLFTVLSLLAKVVAQVAQVAQTALFTPVGARFGVPARWHAGGTEARARWHRR